MAPQRSDLPWWVAGGAAFALVVVVGWSMVPPPVAVRPDNAPMQGAPTSMDLSAMTPRQTADQLFNQAMTANEAGDTARARQFMPVALQAYEAARPLDLDGLFHLALLHRTMGQLESTLGTGMEILEAEPNHILGLEVAAQAALALGREEEAEDYFTLILEHYDVESARPLVEYQGHMPFLEVARSEAEEFLAGR